MPPTPAGGLDNGQGAEVREVLGGMRRERSGGDAHAVLHSRSLVGHGDV